MLQDIRSHITGHSESYAYTRSHINAHIRSHVNTHIRSHIDTHIRSRIMSGVCLMNGILDPVGQNVASRLGS